MQRLKYLYCCTCMYHSYKVTNALRHQMLKHTYRDGRFHRSISSVTNALRHQMLKHSSFQIYGITGVPGPFCKHLFQETRELPKLISFGFLVHSYNYYILVCSGEMQAPQSSIKSLKVLLYKLFSIFTPLFLLHKQIYLAKI